MNVPTPALPNLLDEIRNKNTQSLGFQRAPFMISIFNDRELRIGNVFSYFHPVCQRCRAVVFPP
jgi:hypothetical protein